MIADWSLDVIAHKTTDSMLKLSTAWIYELIDRDVKASKDDWKTMLLRKYYKRRGPRKGAVPPIRFQNASISTNARRCHVTPKLPVKRHWNCPTR